MARKKVMMKYAPRKKDVPATRVPLLRMCDERKAELPYPRSGTQSLRSEVQAPRHEIATHFEELNRTIDALIEEQRAQSTIILAMLGYLFVRQDRIETKLREQRKLIKGMGRLIGASK